jgi:acyl-CoA thioesterase FadM
MIQEIGVGPVVVDIQIRFSRELVAGDNIIIRTKHEGDIGRTYDLTQYIFKENEEVACKAKIRLAFLDIKLRKIVEAPNIWKEILMRPVKLRMEKTNETL